MKLPHLLQANDSLGVKGENTALEFLLKQGLKLVCKNFNSKFGEIDLIMIDEDTLVFIEVRIRTNKDYGDGFESINFAKQRKIVKTAKYYLSQLDFEQECRFDAIAISDLAEEIKWVKNAFYE